MSNVLEVKENNDAKKDNNTFLDFAYRINERFERKYKPNKKTVPDYQFDKKEGVVKQVGEIDFQEKIQSSADCDYRKIYERFLDNGNIIVNEGLFGSQVMDIAEGVASETTFSDKLENAMEITNIAEAYKNELGLDPNLSPLQVFEKIGNIADKLNATNDIQLKTVSQKLKDIQKKEFIDGGNSDEKKDVSQNT